MQWAEEEATKLLSLPVNTCIVAAREVDTLEGALLEGQWLQDLLHRPSATPLNAQGHVLEEVASLTLPEP